MEQLNYFTCTLGQAAQWKQNVPEDQQSFDTVLDLVDKQAESIGDYPALGFADFTRDETTLLTFRVLRDLSIQATDVLVEALSPHKAAQESQTIGLICSSGLDFVLTWLGLMRLGYTVFLLAPQLDHKGLKHLCKTTSAAAVFIDDGHHDSFKEVQDDNLSLLKVPSFSHQAGEKPSLTSSKNAKQQTQADTAYLRHTSGTSSGLPKPIVQSQLGAVGVLARLPVAKKPVATFSTTPLYHGGLADCFRSWSCGAPIWFFPEGQVPITCANILKAVRFARNNSSASSADGKESGVGNVCYFSSVPYVLQMLSEEKDGIDMLRTMELVGVGGAALPVVIGDKLVDHGVRLVSRMGSAECGFLLSSDRDYDADKEWQFLRCAVDDPEILAFEPQNDGSDLYELVAKPKWPLRNKTNREDGSFATSDLFERHKIITNAWRYHSRSDAQITLANGKKFDPAPLEDAIRAALGRVLQDVLVFGAGREYPGAVLFGRSTEDTEEGLLAASWPAIETLNKSSSSQARLSKSALICVVPKENGGAGAKPPLEKSSKGTLLRKQAEERYSELIESAYSSSSPLKHHRSDVSDEDLPDALLEEFQNLLGREGLDLNEDLFHQGVDSIACIQLRRMIESTFLSPGQSLPLNIIYDCGSVKELAAHIAKMRTGQEGGERSGGNNQKHSDLNLMSELVEKYSKSTSKTPDSQGKEDLEKQGDRESADTVVLTGATGLLGAHILDLLANKPQVQKIYCLVRGQSKHAAEERVRKALAFRGLNAWESQQSQKIICLPADLTSPNLGLDDVDLATIKKETTLVIHGAWTVNFSLRLRSFDNQISGTRNLLDLAASASARFYFISSTAAVGGISGRVEERLSTDPRDASALGYAQSKWVAERLCAAQVDSAASNTASSSSPISIIRIGQLCGSTQGRGVWNASEAYPLMLSTAQITGVLPRLPDQGLNWLPVDQAAAAVVEIATRSKNNNDVPAESEISGSTGKGGNGPRGIQVHHVLQPHLNPTWDEMLDWLSSSDIGPEVTPVTPEEWLKKLQQALSGAEEERRASGSGAESDNKSGNKQEHPAASLLGFWKEKYGSDTGAEKQVSVDETFAGSYIHQDGHDDGRDDLKQGVPNLSKFDVKCTQRISKVMDEVQPLTKSQVLEMWRWICENVGSKD